jgi:hypothetical protein
LITVGARALLIETVSQARRLVVRRERFDLQTLNGGYASVGYRPGFARFAISQSKFPRANCLFRTLRKEKSLIRLLPAHDTGMNGGSTVLPAGDKAAIEFRISHPAASQHLGPDIDDTAIDHSQPANGVCSRAAKIFSFIERRAAKYRTSVTSGRRGDRGGLLSQCAGECMCTHTDMSGNSKTCG